MKNGSVKLLSLLGIILVGNFFFEKTSFAASYDPVSHYARNLIDETRWIIIFKGEESGHGSIKSIIRERYREDVCGRKIQKVYELTYHCESEDGKGVLYIVDGYFRVVKIQERKLYLCPKTSNCQGQYFVLAD